jgi:DNA (cytosine-5)-methyltransferase 1
VILLGNEFKVCSLFSGCGGLDKGFEGNFTFLNKKYKKLPFKIVFANDIMPEACETLKLNFKTKNIICDDIEKIMNKNKNLIPTADVVTGGFPCQDFSLAGKRRGLSSKRGNLYLQMKRVVEYVKPKIFIAENVKGLANLDSALDTIINDFSDTNPKYEIDYRLLLASNYGVPQRRERIIIVGVRKDIAKKMNPMNKKFKFPFPKYTNSKMGNSLNGTLSKWITSKEAIEDLSNDTKFDRQNEFSKAKNYGEHLQGNKKIDANKVSPTIRAEHHGNIEFHYKGHRRLTVRECARIQTFPDRFKFSGSMSKAYVQIGNAVPPVLGWHIANSVKNILKKFT